MTQLFIKIKAFKSLGFLSLVRVLLYRAGMKLSLNPVKRLQGKITEGLFYSLPSVSSVEAAAIAGRCANNDWTKSLSYFSWLLISHDSEDPPDWFFDPFSETKFLEVEKPWWKIPDFGATGADIKCIWELSRFDWVIAFAQQAAKGEDKAIRKLNSWLSDWIEKNPPYLGPNWKCGQEASIRVMHLLLAAMFLEQTKNTTPTLVSIVECHLRRIRPTLMYALGQNNNHGTSEAAALFMGGVFLRVHGIAHGTNYERLGHKYLNDRAVKLILPDGTFSQYSMTYHRVMLETFSLCEIWARRHKIRLFTEASVDHILTATLWLEAMLIDESGDVPNLGANDGVNLLPLTGAKYRDFRPCTAVASALFGGSYSSKEPHVRDHMAWLNLPIKAINSLVPNSKKTQHMPNGGYVGLRERSVFAMLSYPTFQFRPSQSDLMHLDVWVKDINLLRDGGSYSYNSASEKMSYYSGVKSHNTIEFDEREQMPRISRFLFGEWPNAYDVSVSGFGKNKNSCCAAYKDWKGVYHKRSVLLDGMRLDIVDECSGFLDKATLRWRLAPANWKVTANTVESNLATITIQSIQAPLSFDVVQGFESKLYMQETELPVLEVVFGLSESMLAINTTVHIK